LHQFINTLAALLHQFINTLAALLQYQFINTLAALLHPFNNTLAALLHQFINTLAALFINTLAALLQYDELGWEPSVAQVNHSYTAVYPHLVDFTGKLNFAIYLDPQNQAKNIPVVLPSCPTKISKGVHKL